jgi:hypothetical protein
MNLQPSDAVLAVQRTDMEAAMAALRHEMNRVSEALIAIGGVGGTVAIWLSGLQSDQGSLLPVTFVGGWALLIGLNIRNLRRYRRMVSRYGLACPACFKPLIEMIEWRGSLKRADVVLGSGRCPDCDQRVFAREA